MNEKAKTGKGSAKEAMEFGYAKRDIKDLPKDYKKVLEKYKKCVTVCKKYKIIDVCGLQTLLKMTDQSPKV